MSKARRKDLNKINTHKSNIPGERLYSDISYVNSLSLGKKRFWILFVDEYSRFKWSDFVERKSDFISTAVSRLRELIYMKLNPKYLRIDNSGENIKLKSYLINNINCHSIRNINIEFTAPHTPQQNGVVERRFSFLYDKVREILNRAGFPLNLRELFWAECCNMETQLDNILVKRNNCSYELIFKKYPKVWIELHGFREICI